jgi:nucleoside-diphosphate-sugar epimerase
MDADDQLHVVVGATGGAGGALVRELAGRGRRVRAVSRKPAAALPQGVEQLAADAADPAQMRTACQGATVVYHCAQPPYERWAAEFPALTASIAQAAAAAGARLVYADNLYAYGPVAGPITEDLPALATTKKGRVRTLMAERLLAAHRSGTLQVAIGRSSDYYGPGGANSAVGDILFGAAATGKAARWLGRLDVPHSLNYLQDVARALLTLASRPEAPGEVWHLPAAEPLTGRRFVELIALRSADPSRSRRPPGWRCGSLASSILVPGRAPSSSTSGRARLCWTPPSSSAPSAPLTPPPTSGPLPPRSPGSGSRQVAPVTDAVRPGRSGR